MSPVPPIKISAPEPPSTALFLPAAKMRSSYWPPFIIILPLEEIPATQHVRGSNFCHIGVVSDHNKDRSVVISVLDNLIKGSAGQAIQNANIMFDFDETSGLFESPIFPWNE